MQVDEFPPFNTLLQSPAGICERVKDMGTAQGAVVVRVKKVRKDGKRWFTAKCLYTYSGVRTRLHNHLYESVLSSGI